MKQEQSSRSAEGVAALRAIEAQKPEAERICNDPLAWAFTPGGIGYTISKLIITSGLYDRMAPGAVPFVVVRERYIDDFLKASLAEGLDQVVILGAGFDTRAYRIAGIEKTRIFEIDHPATQAEKLKRLKKVIDPLPKHVTFLPVDFNTQTLDERLLPSGYNEQAKTLFIWQGVTYFLTAEGVDNTLAFIARHSGSGSAVIFDYFYSEVFSDPSNSYAKALRRAAQLSGEEYMFGIERGRIEPFLSQRGFKDVHNMTLEDLKQLYFTGKNAGRVVPRGIAIASARVNKP
jgi:methyltransferase (TIGR00027 family)